ncbi:MAG TPA: aminotransferase class IV [Gemmatimonadales bacterium]|nr:aminotransferase class IV [Gemmatimonadales bacterium]
MSRPAALFESIRVRNGTAPLWPLHLARLRRSAADLGIPLPRRLEAPSGADRVVRLEAGEAGCSTGERAVGTTRPIRLVTVAEVHPGYSHKLTAREAFEAARQAARQGGADDALLLTAAGRVAEATIWTLFWWDGARLATPALGLGVLPGVARARLALLAGGLAEREVLPAGLHGRSLFVANAARGVVAVAELDGVPVPGDPRSMALSAAFWP